MSYLESLIQKIKLQMSELEILEFEVRLYNQTCSGQSNMDQRSVNIVGRGYDWGRGYEEWLMDACLISSQ